MSRYVDIEILAESLCNECVAVCEGKEGLRCGLKEFIDSLPTVDAAPVVHGHWGEPQRDGCITYDKNAYRQCSVCGNRQYLGMKMNYCPQCGAKMDALAKDINVRCKTDEVTE